MRRIDLTGKTFGRLAVKKYLFSHNGNSRFLCYCSCGNMKEIDGRNLREGSTISCGCVKKEFLYGNRAGTKSSRWQGYEDLPLGFFNRIRTGAKKRKITFDLTIEKLWLLYLRQNKKCIFTGENLDFPAYNKQKIGGSASLDRIDSSKGYVVDNVQWVHKTVNFMKQRMSDDEFLGWCRKIASYRKQ